VARLLPPYSFAPLNHFTVPFSLTKKLLSPLVKNYSFVSYRFASAYPNTRYRSIPLKRREEFFLTSPWASDDAPTETAPLYFVKRLHTATKYCGAAKTKARYRTADTETSILLARQPGPANEAPDNSRKILVGKSEVAGIKL
jgi:hypothetical protein